MFLNNTLLDAQPNTSANVIQVEFPEKNGKAAKPKRIRTSFTSFQLKRLEEVFKQMHVITKTAKYNLSLELNLREIQIKIWFQNRRVKEKKEKSRAANNAGTALQTPANRNYSTEHNHPGWNTTLMNSQMLPPCQYDMAQKFSPSTSYYANSAALLDQTAYQNNLLLQVSSSSSSYNTNSPPMDHTQGYQNAALQMPSTSNSSPILIQNIGYHDILQMPSTASNNSKSSLQTDLAIPYQYNDFPSNISSAAVKPILPTSYQSNSPTIDPTSCRFDGIQGDIVAPQFITPSFKNEDCVEQYPSLNDTNNYLNSIDISYCEIQQILGNSY